MIDFGNNFGYLSNKNLRKTLKMCDEHIDQLTKKCEILEENNKLLIQQKYQMYEDLDIAYDKIDKAIEYIKDLYDVRFTDKDKRKLLEILGDKEIEEIPQFKGTLEQLDNLTILGDKENE